MPEALTLRKKLIVYSFKNNLSWTKFCYVNAGKQASGLRNNDALTQRRFP